MYVRLDFQTDSLLIEPLDFNMFEYDYVGSPWNRNKYTTSFPDYSKDLNVIGRLMSEANTVLMARQSAYKSNLNLDDQLTLNIRGENKSVKIVGWLTPDNSVSKVATADLIISDISTAQELLRSQGLISGIDLVIPKGQLGTQIVDISTNSLPHRVAVQIDANFETK